jgi:predicted molibdopterin-dependent oxidoreductase YjgC
MKIIIDNNSLEVAEGSTILEAAGKAGLVIPTLCHAEGIEHYSSCMVCMVKDKARNEFIPSCTALVRDGMEIEASSEEVKDIRKRSVELLLSEHRAECEAPCAVVCPAGYPVPEMNRLLAAGKVKEAADLSISFTYGEALKCIECPGYCENACRRKKIDLPVSIRNLQIFVYGNINEVKSNITGDESTIASGIDKKRFSSRTGRINESELKEWIIESTVDAPRFRDISDFRMAGTEAESCMHCDCRAKDDCDLRELAQALKVKDPVGKVSGYPVSKKINRSTGLIFENAKCIKCGLCVRACEDSNEEPSLCFLNRGFVSIISEPLTDDFNSLLATQTAKCIEICPTGALALFKTER